MNIKRADDKPMVIHTKKKAKIHTVRSRRIRVKGRNVLTVERGHRTCRAYIRPVKNPAARNRIQASEKDMEPKHSIAQSTSKAALNEQKNLGGMRQQLNYPREIKTSKPPSRQGDTRQEQTSYRDATQQKARSYQRTQYQPKQVSLEQRIKKKDTAVTIAAATVTSKTAEQLDGGEELRDAASVSDQLTNPLLSAGSKGAQYFKEKTLEERKRRIKVVGQKKSIDRIKPSGRNNMIDFEHSNHKSQLSDDDVREDTATDQKQDMADSKRKHRYYIRKTPGQMNGREYAKKKQRNTDTNISKEFTYTQSVGQHLQSLV